MRKPKYLEKVSIRTKDVHDCKEKDGEEFMEVDKKSKKVEQKPSLADRRVTWGKRKGKVEPKDPSTYVDTSIKNEDGERKSKNYLTKDTKMMGKQKSTKQLQLDDAFPMLSQEKRHVRDMECIELNDEFDMDIDMMEEQCFNTVENEGCESEYDDLNSDDEISDCKVRALPIVVKGKELFLTQNSEDEVIYSLTKNEMTKVINTWKESYPEYTKKTSKLSLYQLRNEIKKIRMKMKMKKSDSDSSQSDSEVNLSPKRAEKTPTKAMRKSVKPTSSKKTMELPVVFSQDKSIMITPRTSDSVINKCLKSQLLEILKIWCKDNKIVWSSVFANMSKIALVSEIKKIRRSLTKVWAHEYSVSLKKNLEGFVCINKNTQDSEIESLDIEKLIRIIQWWNARWGEAYEDKQVLNQSQKKLEDEVKKIRDEISAGGIHKKLSDYTKIFGNKKEIKKKRIENLSGDKFARKMTPKEKEASDWKESANEDIQEKAEKWCVSYTKEGSNKLRELVNAKRSFDITKGVVMKDANRDVTTDWGRQKLFAIAYWKQSRVDGEFMSVSEICDKDDDGIAELVDKIHLRCSKKRHALDQHSKKRKKESVTDMGNIDDKKKRDEEAMLEEYTRKENERKAIEWYEGLEGRPIEIKVEKFMSTTPIQERNKAILEIASIVWNAYECQSDIVQGGLVDELDHDLLKSYCYFFQKDEKFKDWEVIKTFDNETVAKTIKYMIEKTKLKFCEGEIKTFQVQRELMQEEKDLLNWKYSSGPMVVAKVKKYELEMEEMFGSNIEIELQSIRTAFNWTRGVLSKFKMKNCERNKIKSVDSKTLSISVYWNQKQDINHIKLKAINEMREDQLYKFALRVNDLVRRNVNYTSGDVTSAPKDKDVVMKDVVNTEFEQTKTEAMEFASMDWEKSEFKKNEPVPIVTPAKTLSIKKKWNENRIGSSTKLASQTSITNYTNCTSDVNESGGKGIKITPKETPYIKEGININMMSTKQKVINKGLRKNDLNHPLPLNTEEEIKIPVESTPVLKMRDVTARFEIAVDDQLKVNIPLVARQTFRLFKQADRTCRLMPFYGNGNEDLEAIDEEDGIPNEESKIKMWVDNPRFISTKLHFSMRISTMVPLKHIKDTLFPWMAKNKSYVKLDK